MLPQCSVAVLPECSVAVHINVLHSHASLFAQCAIRSFVAIQTSPVQIGQGHRCALSHPRWPSLSPKVPVSTTVPHLSLRTGATLDQPPFPGCTLLRLHTLKKLKPASLAPQATKSPGWVFPAGNGGSRRQGGSVLMIFIGCGEGSLSGRGRFCPDAGRFCADSARCMLLNGQRSGLSTNTINVAERGAE